VVKPWLRFRSA